MSGIRNVFCLFLICIILEKSSGKSYCEICRDHTMCKAHYNSPACAAVTYRLSQDQKNKIVNLHNTYRQKVASGNEKRGSPGPQPRAKYIPNLTWDNELENIAQTLANSCKFGHDSCRNVERFSVGQNIAKGTVGSGGATQTLLALVSMWYNEVTKFNPNGIDKYRFEPQTGHYTQLVWAKTTKIGCGYVYEKNGNSALLVCNYGPTGNFIGQKIYEIRR